MKMGRTGKLYFTLCRLTIVNTSRSQDQENVRARFYERYCKLAEENDRRFTKKYHKEMNTALIFVCRGH